MSFQIQDFTGFTSGSQINNFASAAGVIGDTALKTIGQLGVAENAQIAGKMLQDSLSTETSQSKRETKQETNDANKEIYEYTTPFGKPCDPAIKTLFCQKNTPEPEIVTLKEIRAEKNECVEYYTTKVQEMEAVLSDLGILDDGSFTESLSSKAQKKVDKELEKNAKDQDEEQAVLARLAELDATYASWLGNIDEMEFATATPIAETGWSFDAQAYINETSMSQAFSSPVTTAFPLFNVPTQNDILAEIAAKVRGTSVVTSTYPTDEPPIYNEVSATSTPERWLDETYEQFEAFANSMSTTSTSTTQSLSLKELKKLQRELENEQKKTERQAKKDAKQLEKEQAKAEKGEAKADQEKLDALEDAWAAADASHQLISFDYLPTFNRDSFDVTLVGPTVLPSVDSTHEDNGLATSVELSSTNTSTPRTQDATEASQPAGSVEPMVVGHEESDDIVNPPVDPTDNVDLSTTVDNPSFSHDVTTSTTTTSSSSPSPDSTTTTTSTTASTTTRSIAPMTPMSNATTTITMSTSSSSSTTMPYIQQGVDGMSSGSNNVILTNNMSTTTTTTTKSRQSLLLTSPTGTTTSKTETETGNFLERPKNDTSETIQSPYGDCTELYNSSLPEFREFCCVNHELGCEFVSF